jgi:DNA-binding beta-propeller fold protein YncE
MFKRRIYLRFAVVFFVITCWLLFRPLQASADGGAPNLAYVSGTAQGISAIDISQQKVTNTLALTGDPHTILLSIDGRLLYVTQPELGLVVVIAAKTQQEVCKAKLAGRPTLLTLDPGTNTLYAAGNEATTVSALDPTTCAVKQTLRTQGGVYGLAVAVVGLGIAGGTGNQIWVADERSLKAFDSAGKQITSIPVAGGPGYICIPTGPTLYVTTRQGSVVTVDLNTKQVLATLLQGGPFGPMDYDAITGKVYVPDILHKQLDVLTPVNGGMQTFPHEPGRIIQLDGEPQAVAITSDGQLGFVALDNGRVVMLDVPGRQIVQTFTVGGTPHFVVTGLYPSLFSLTPQQATGINILSILLHYGGAAVIVLVAVVAVVWNRVRYYRKRGSR